MSNYVEIGIGRWRDCHTPRYVSWANVSLSHGNRGSKVVWAWGCLVAIIYHNQHEFILQFICSMENKDSEKYVKL